MSTITLTEESGTPATPATSKWLLYAKSDGFYYLDDTGNEVGPLSTGAALKASAAQVSAGTSDATYITPLALRTSDTPSGWISTSETWTFYNRSQAFTNTPAAGASTVFTMTNTTGFVVGDRVMITSGGGTDYPIITAVTTNTNITVTYTDYAHTAVNPLVTSLGKFTISGDYTGIFTKGTRVKWTQTTMKYGVVAYSLYSGGTTTVSLVVNTDYTVTNAAITATYYSRLESPLGWPGWFNYNAQPQGWGTSPHASAVYRYSISPTTVIVALYTPNPGATSTTTLINFVGPVPSASYFYSTWGQAQDNGVQLTTPGRIWIGATSPVIAANKDATTGTWTAALAKRVSFTLIYQW